ncbi:hypothetical protein PT23B2_15780 [Acinetobacter towneri]
MKIVGSALVVVGTVTLSSNTLAGYAAGNNGNACSVHSDSISIGSQNGNDGNACASMERSIAIGQGASTAVVPGSTGTYNEAIAIGAKARASGAQAIAIGGQTVASGNSSIAIGADDLDRVASTNAPAYNYTPSSGDNAKYNNSTVAQEYNQLTNAWLVDFEKTNNAQPAVGNRYTAVTAGEAGVALGSKSVAGNLATALGPVATSQGLASVALGMASNASGKGALAIGSVSKASEEGAVAIGINAKASGKNAVALGSGKTAATSARAQGEDSVAIGSGALSEKNYAVSIGQGAGSEVEAGVALGKGSLVKGANSVALGIGSIAEAQSGASYLTNVAATTAGTVSVGSAGSTRRITNVADGSADSDAVTVAQLKQLKTITDATQATADKGINFGDGTSHKNYKLGDTINVKGDSNVTSTTTADGVQLALAKDITVDSLTAGDTVLNQDGLSFVDATNQATGPSITKTGINAGDLKITNVAAGTVASNSKDAINGGQLYNAQNNVKDILGSSTTVDAAGNLTAQNIGDVAGANTVHDAIKSVNETAAKGISFGDGSTANNYKLGDTINVKGDSNVTSTTTADGVQLALAKDITVDSLTAGDTVLNQDGLSFVDATNQATGPSITKTGINAGDLKITNVAAGTVASNSKDAINGGQLYNAQNNVKDILGSSTTVDAAGNLTAQNIGDVAGANTVHDAIKSVNETAAKGISFGDGSTANNYKLGDTINVKGDSNVTSTTTADGVQLALAKDITVDSLTAGDTVLNQDGLSFVDATNQATGPSITKTGINAGDLKITNVAAGTVASNSKDAINGGQLYNAQNNVKDILGSSTTVDAAGNLTAQNIGDVAGANTVHDAIKSVNETAAKGISFGDGSTANNYKLGDTINVKGDSNVTSTTTADGVQLALAKDITVDSLTAGDTVLNQDGLSFVDATNQATGPSITKTGINAGDLKITNVAAGTVASNSKDAINGGQLYNAQNNVKDILGSSTTVDAAGNLTAQNIGDVAGANTVHDAIKSVNETAAKGISFGDGSTANNYKLGDTINVKGDSNVTSTTTADGVQLALAKDITVDSLTAGDTVLNQDGLSFVDATNQATGPSITKTGINAGDLKITNVAAGTVASNSKDAINGGQLYNAQNNVKDILGSSTTVDAAGNLTAQNIGDVAGANTVHDAIKSVNETAAKGISFGDGSTANNYKLGDTINER